MRPAGKAKLVKWATAALTILTVYEDPDCSGKRKIGKLNGKEMSIMKKLTGKHERTVITSRN